MNEKTQIQNENTKYEIRMKNSWGLLSVAQNLQASNALVRLYVDAKCFDIAKSCLNA